MKLRGSGDLLGTRQSGDMEFQMADIFRDADILQKASEAASELLADDPYFEKPEHELLKKVMKSYLDLENHDIGLWKITKKSGFKMQNRIKVTAWLDSMENDCTISWKIRAKSDITWNAKKIHVS